MRREAALNVVARHFLVRADRALAAAASIAVAARDDRRNNNRVISIVESICAGIDNMTADLVPERKRQCMLGAYTIIILAKVRVADAAASDFD